ncbi:hypothetical protein Mp_3g18690 [Marchantia polymorpha subsp. ruderalis]|uniref:Uncharacterized protein n=2 Tax=Marchantia polymorpha TaxID=3197 RepID=A0AAF6B2A3_MARPO|nr:hypothetical protein MARPO_0142s0025 [Marchantia polymorpha]BBN06137.1 hypothetical protein Mp_3g18690 [Marchantia polymorpha subsp. ruderalis]|eukprot:PTQ29396.1 hypothetical protein MARPO_0142s0025 [Marchantia polymorpha]
MLSNVSVSRFTVTSERCELDQTCRQKDPSTSRAKPSAVRRDFFVNRSPLL